MFSWLYQVSLFLFFSSIFLKIILQKLSAAIVYIEYIDCKSYVFHQLKTFICFMGKKHFFDRNLLEKGNLLVFVYWIDWKWGVLCWITGKTTCLFRHDLKMLHSKQANRLSLPMNKIPEKLIPRSVMRHK